MGTTRITMFAAKLIIVASLLTSWATASPAAIDLRCSVTSIQQATLADLGGRFRYSVGSGTNPAPTITSTLLLLDRDGNVWDSLPLENGDEFEVHLRDEHQAKAMSNAVRWLVRSPGILIRAEGASRFLILNCLLQPVCGG